MKTEDVMKLEELRTSVYSSQVDERSIALDDIRAALANALEVSRLRKDTVGGREMAITVTELEKVVAYFEKWVS